MPRESSPFALPWSVSRSTIAAGIVVAIARALLVWQLPRVGPHGVGLIMLAGLGLGVFGLLRRPSWQTRSILVSALVVAAVVVNLLWFREIDREDSKSSFRRQEDDLLSTRYYEHHHWIPRQKSAYFVMADLLEGRQIRYIEGSQLSKWRLAALAEPSEIVELDPPDYPLPTAQQLADRYPYRPYQLYSPRWRGEERLYQMVGITEGAEKAEYFVVLEVEGVDFVIPDSVWEAMGRGQRPPGPR
jgi:hypothetical protein